MFVTRNKYGMTSLEKSLPHRTEEQLVHSSHRTEEQRVHYQRLAKIAVVSINYIYCTE